MGVGRPTVAVVVPVKDEGHRIRDLVSAIEGQTVQPLQFVVVDNGSTDDTAAIASSAGAQVIVETRPGSYAARNAGISAVDAEVIAFTDGDCLPRPDWLERLVEPFSDPSVGGVAGRIDAVETRTAAQRWALERHLLDQEAAQSHRFLPFAATANVAYRRSILEKLNGFDAAMHSGGDVDLAWRMQVHAGMRLAYAPEAVVMHHQRERVRPLLRQQRRYGEGHVLLTDRWRHDRRFMESVGAPAARLKTVWMAPFRVVARLATGRDASLALIDAGVAIAREIGRISALRRRHKPDTK